MAEPPDGAVDRTTRTLDQELGLVRDAITMVASGGSRRVVVANLWFGEQLIEPARRMASKAGVRIEPFWTADDVGADIAVERIGDG